MIEASELSSKCPSTKNGTIGSKVWGFLKCKLIHLTSCCSKLVCRIVFPVVQCQCYDTDGSYQQTVPRGKLEHHSTTSALVRQLVPNYLVVIESDPFPG